MRGRIGFLTIGFLALALVAAGCSSTPEEPSGSTGGAVDVTLREYTVSLSRATAAAGSVAFAASNEGTIEHELVVVRTSLDVASLPVKADGGVDEEGAGIEIVDEIPEFVSGTTESKTLTLSAGTYVLFCNIGDHYKRGMRTAFTVSP